MTKVNVTFPQIPERSRGRSGVEPAHTRAAARSERLDPGLYASAHVPQYPGNVINRSAPLIAANRKAARTRKFTKRQFRELRFIEPEL